MFLYQLLSKIPFLRKSFVLKILSVTFIGIHIPLLAVIFILILPGHESLSPLLVGTTVLAFTLIATGVTLLVLNRLLVPIRKVKNSLEDYLHQSKLPHLPYHYEDEVGLLMNDTQYALTQLDALFQEKRSLLALLTHDLKNGFGNTVKALQLIQMGEKEPDEMVDVMQKSASAQVEFYSRSMEMLLNDHFTNKFAKNIREVDVSEMVDQIIQGRKASLDHKELNISKELPPMTVNLKSEILSKVVSNVLDNAIKFTPKGGNISVQGGSYDNMVVVKVRDQGIGFQATDVHKIFQANSPMGRRGTEGEKSRGVGMYLCKTLIEKNGGSIMASSEGPNKGSTFVISIPVEAVQ